MAKKIKQTSQKSIRKNLLDKVESRLTESFMDFPKKISEKKLRKHSQSRQDSYPFTGVKTCQCIFKN
jgi:hypothetical protein